jgi:hypothetical protein
MKKFLLLLASISILTGCSVMKTTEREVYTYFADYSKYAEVGFLISPDAYSGEFESLGEIEISITPAIKEHGSDGNFGPRGKYLDYEVILYDEAVDIAVAKAIEKGANALVNFSITATEIASSDSWGQYAKGVKYNIKGFCIKRK